LLDIVRPQSVASIVNSFGERYQRNGRAETAFIQGKDFQVGQGGDEVDRIVGDAWAKGIPGIDWEKVWPLLEFNAGRRTNHYRTLGYVSNGNRDGYDSRMESGSSTIAFAHGDYCAARVGESLGHTAEAQALYARSQNWRNVWDVTATGDGFAGFLRGRNSNGSFSTTSPTGGSGSDFYQGTCWNYSFNIHDRESMIGLMGGRARFIQRLEFAFGKGSTSYLDFSNEVNLQAVPLLSRVSRPNLAAYWANEVRKKYAAYTYPGDEDSGAMASLYFFLTAGFIPSATEDTYYLHGPRVPRLEFDVGGGKTFTLLAENAGNENLYIQSATLDGVPLATPVIHHADIMAGKTLAFVMGPYPGTWGTGGDFKAPERREQVIPMTGVWSASLGTPVITGAETNTAVWGNGSDGADNSAIQSAFPDVTLANAGDSVVLTAAVKFNGLSASQAGAASRFAWGLFNNNGQSGSNRWSGYLAANDVIDAAGTQKFWGRTSASDTAYHATSGASALASYALPGPEFADGMYRLVLSLTRTAAGAIDCHAALVRAADGVLCSAFTGSDLAPATFTFNRVGFRAGDALDADSIEVSDFAVVFNPAVQMSAYESWKLGNGNVANPDLDDSGDGDGLPLLLEYAFGLNPATSDSTPVTFDVPSGQLLMRGTPSLYSEATTNGREFHAVFLRRKGDSGLTYTPQFSHDLSEWIDDPTMPEVIASDAEMELVSIPFPPSSDTSGARFFRMAVTAKP
jgi:hypothetical protein